MAILFSMGSGRLKLRDTDVIAPFVIFQNNQVNLKASTTGKSKPITHEDVKAFS